MAGTFKDLGQIVGQGGLIFWGFGAIAFFGGTITSGNLWLLFGVPVCALLGYWWYKAWTVE